MFFILCENTKRKLVVDVMSRADTLLVWLGFHHSSSCVWSVRTSISLDINVSS